LLRAPALEDPPIARVSRSCRCSTRIVGEVHGAVERSPQCARQVRLADDGAKLIIAVSIFT
jgi:hypothetical protein